MAGLLDNLANAPQETGVGNALMAAAAALLTPSIRGGGLGSAFAAMPQAIQQAQMQSMQNRLFGLKERGLNFEMNQALTKQEKEAQAAANRARFLGQIERDGGFRPDMMPAGIAAGFKPEELKDMAGANRWGMPTLAFHNGAALDPQTGQPVAAVPNPNQPFNLQMGSDGQLRSVANEPYQRFKLTDSKAGAPTVSNYIMPATPGQEASDKKFAADFVDFATGGYADVTKQIDQLKEAANALRSGKPISGPFMGNLPDSVLAVTNPQAVSTKEMIQEVAQRNLRLILGAQFTEKEGERLISRVYNPRLNETENAKRVDRLIKQISTAAQAKLDAAQYFREHGSLTGWQGKLPRLSDFDPDFTKKDDDKGSGQPKRLKFNPATGRLE